MREVFVYLKCNESIKDISITTTGDSEVLLTYVSQKVPIIIQLS